MMRRLEADPMDKSVNPLVLAASTNPQVVELFMRCMDTYPKGSKGDLFLFRCIDALEGIYERTHDANIGQYIRDRYPDLDATAKTFVLDDCPFADELIPILKGALVDSSDPYLHTVAAWRIEREPSIWPQMQGDVYTRADVESDDMARRALQELKDRMLGR